MKRMRLLLGFFILLATGIALWFRVVRLEERLMHSDEANQAYKTGELIDGGTYVYNPELYHGPTLYYLTLPVAKLCGAESFKETREATFRIVPALFGTLLVLLLWAIRHELGRGPVVWAAFLTAVSPAMTYYSRYYIQEMLLVFLTFGVIIAGWRYAKSGKLGWALLAGACVGLMHATKETCVIAYAGFGAGVALTYVWSRRREGEIKQLSDTFRPRHLVYAGVAAVTVSFAFYSSFFTNLSGPLDSMRAYASYFHLAGGGEPTAEGGGSHVHPWYYYLQMLLLSKEGRGPWWSEGFIVLLFIAGTVVAIRGKGSGGNTLLVRFLAVYTVFMTVAYCAIPYKTPWCMLGFLHGMILIGGVGAASLVRWFSNQALRAIVCILLVAGVSHLAWQAYACNFVYAEDPRNPYAYVHTMSTFMGSVERIEEIAKIHPEKRRMVIKVFYPESDYWPLPWYLRKFEQVGYWPNVPDEPDASVILCAARIMPELKDKLRDTYQVEYFGMRPNELLVLFIRSDLWDAFMKTRE